MSSQGSEPGTRGAFALAVSSPDWELIRPVGTLVSRLMEEEEEGWGSL